MIGKRVKLLIPFGGQQAGDEGIIKSSCGCAIPGWRVEFAGQRVIEIKQHGLNVMFALVDY